MLTSKYWITSKSTDFRQYPWCKQSFLVPFCVYNSHLIISLMFTSIYLILQHPSCRQLAIIILIFMRALRTLWCNNAATYQGPALNHDSVGFLPALISSISKIWHTSYQTNSNLLCIHLPNSSDGHLLWDNFCFWLTLTKVIAGFWICDRATEKLCEQHSNSHQINW